jgi:hypothetical protein
MAAKLAAEATLFALMGYPEALVRQLGNRAEAAHQQALVAVEALRQQQQGEEHGPVLAMLGPAFCCFQVVRRRLIP